MTRGEEARGRIRSGGGLTWAHVVACLLVLLAGLPAAARADGITNGGDDLRDGWYGDEPALSPDVVGGSTFGELWNRPVDGSTYAQPLVLGQRVIVATERNQVSSLDAATGLPQWQTRLVGAPFQSSDIGCSDLTPDLGVTATPVIDPATSTIYLTHKGYDPGQPSVARWWLDALDTATGQERAGFPVSLSGVADDAPGVAFTPRTEQQRPGLLLLGGVVYAAFGSHCDIGPWQGWVFGVSTGGQVRARWVARASGNWGAGIWQSGSGIMSDGSGRLFVTTGNGGAPAPGTAGSSPGGELGESVVRLAVQPDGTLKAKDFFAPLDAASLDGWDADFASGGVTALRDDAFGTTATPHLAFAAGKSGYVYLLNRDDLGGIATGPGGGDRVVQRLGPFGGVWSRAAVWPGDGGWVYLPTASSVGDINVGGAGVLDLYAYAATADGQARLTAAGSSTDAFGYGTSAPVVTSDGTTSGTALVWVVWMGNAHGDNAQLRAYDALPQDGAPHLRGSWPVGQASKFNPPGVGDGHVYVATRDGHVLAFGSPVDAAVTGGSASFPATVEGSTSAPVTATLHANAHVTITAISATAGFGVGTGGLGLPRTLESGDALAVPVTFSPTTAGPMGGTLTATTNLGAFTATLTGTGLAQGPQLGGVPKEIAFDGLVVGQTRTDAITIWNYGSQPLTISSIDPPDGPFTLGDVPPPGTVVGSDAKIAMSATFAPTAKGTFTSQTVIHTDGGDATVGLSGAGALGARLEITPAALDFGDVATGTSADRSFTVVNSGDAPAQITISKPPALGAFTALDGLDEGTQLAPGDVRTLHVRFTPAGTGAAADGWSIGADDGQGRRTVALTGTGVVPSAPAPGGGAGGGQPGPGGGGGPGPRPPRVAARLRLLAPVLAPGGRTLTARARLASAATGRVTVWVHLRLGRRRVTRVSHGRAHAGTIAVPVRLGARLGRGSRVGFTVRFLGDAAVLPQTLRGTLVVR